jgi:hypothetical protein
MAFALLLLALAVVVAQVAAAVQIQPAVRMVAFTVAVLAAIYQAEAIMAALEQFVLSTPARLVASHQPARAIFN